MSIVDDLDQLALETMRAKLRAAQNEEAKTASERRVAELTEQKVIEALARRAQRKGGGK